ncbi:MAG: SMP-30/gluconolactonase/LRE family protein [Verrucomicrobia bacterium]|nr:SMP-30/gluconolactonase/LRE family protein [Verrucomicrobiota bacterium]
MKPCAFLTLALFAQAAGLAAADFDIKDESEFKRIVPDSAKVTKLAGNMRFLEGPVWNPAYGGSLIFSDIPANELKQWTEKDGLKTFRQPSNNANGNCLDNQGRLVTAEHGGRRISITERDSSVQTVVGQFEGKNLNSPNDVVVKSDGTIWFTDPDYGLAGRPKEQPGNFVYRFDPKTKEVKALVRDFDKPNGLCFSPDEKKLYVADSGKPRHIRVFDVQSDGALANGKVFCQIDKGGPDGIRCDKEGRMFSSAGDGVQIFATDGRLIGKILVPESPANLAFGGKDHKTLFITARTSLYSIPLLVAGDK